MKKSTFDKQVTHESSVFDIFVEYSTRSDESKLFDEFEIYASAESTFYERAVEEFWRDPIGLFGK